ncbi:MAG: ABC transporter permease, partial [Microbacterium sp.]
AAPVAPPATGGCGELMIGYIAKRVSYAVIVVWAAYTATFVLLYVLPADPVSIMLAGSEGSTSATAEERATLEAQFGFDKPVVVQYVVLLGRALTGDFGISVQSQAPVADEIAQALPQTVQLALLGIVFGLILGTGIAVAANLTRSRALGNLLFSVPPLVASVPPFLIALLILQVFSFELGLFPSRGNDGIGSLILPALTLGIAISATIAQLLAKGIHDSLSQPFVDVLRAKGLSRWGIQIGHVLKNAAIPTLTVLALLVGGIFSGAVVIETVFSRVGVGRLLQSAVETQDIPVVQALVILSAFAYAIVNLAVDLTYPLLDPRIRRVAAG